MINTTYSFKTFYYVSVEKHVAINIEFTSENDCLKKIGKLLWNGTHEEAKKLGIDNNPRAIFIKNDVKVVLGVETRGEEIPIQVCKAIEKMSNETFEKLRIEMAEKIEKSNNALIQKLREIKME